MARVFDVAEYILSHTGEITAMKLQKLVYYAQAWSLVWDEAPLFGDQIEAWANGPVARKLYDRHRGRFNVQPGTFSGDANNLTASQKETVDQVVKFYGEKSGQWLSDLTHSEPPWKSARKGLKPGERSSVEIQHSAMAEYYGAL